MIKRLLLAVTALLSAPAMAQSISQLPAATTPLSGTEVLPIVQSGTTKKATVSSVRGEVNVINVTQAPYNCVGNGSTDDSACIKAAFTAASAGSGTTEIYFPPAPGGAYYKYCPPSSPTLTITKPNITVRGSGWAGFIGVCQTSGDFIHASPASGPNLAGLQVIDLSVYAIGANPSSGALLHMENVNGYRVSTTSLNAYYGGLFLDGAVNGIVDVNIQSDANFTALATGSYLIKVGRSAAGTYTAETFIGPCDCRGQNGNNYLDYSILITGADGVWFDQPHIGFSRYGMALAPETNSTQMTSVIVKGGYIDTTSLQGLYVARPSSSYAADFGLHDMEWSNIYNTGDDAVSWVMATSGRQLWSNLRFGTIMNAGHNGINISLGQAINIQDGWSVYDPGMTAAVGCGAAGTCNGLLLNNASTNINVGWGVVQKVSSTTVNCAFQSTSSVTNFQIGVVRWKGTDFGNCDSSVTANKSIATPLNW